MNNEQNIDDILELLKKSVNEPTEGEAAPDLTENRSPKMSEEELQMALKRQYADEDIFGKPSSSKTPYDLDHSMLEEFSSNEEVVEEALETADIDALENQEDTSDIEETDTSEDITDIDVNDIEEADIVSTVQDTPTTVTSVAVLEDDYAFDETDAVDNIDTYEDIDIVGNVGEENGEAASSDISEEADEALLTSDIVENDIVQDMEITPSEDNVQYADESDEYADYPKYKPISFKALMMDYGRPDPVPEKAEDISSVNETETEEDTPDIGDILSDFVDNTPTHDAHVNTAMRDLMSKLGCEEELENVSPEAIGEIFAEYEGVAAPYDEAGSAGRKKKRREGYRASIISAALRLAACGLLTIGLLFYDILPIFDVDFLWLADYVAYPSGYVMIGTQLLLLCAVCLWEPLWNGIKKLATLYPNMYSMVAVLVFVNVAYDVVFFISGSYDPLTVPMFHFLSGVVIFSVCLMDFISLWREAGAFDLYSTDMAKFTLTRDGSKNSIANKMYSGGFSREKKVYSLSPVSRPKGFTAAIREEGSFNNRFYCGLLFVAPLVSVILGISLLIFSRSIDEAAVAMMSLLFVMLPFGAVVSVGCQFLFVSLGLTKRGIALTGRKMIKKYANAGALCFNDINLFEKCEARDVGFVCYEKSQTYPVLAALQILYSRIGGPMSEVFSKIPDKMKAKKIRVRRITKSGVEAVIDKSHILLVGDLEFMKRYGIDFPNADPSASKGKNALIYVSYDGKASAKISAKYTVDPFFDMLIERLASEGGHCVIETYDPMINTTFVARLRKKGRAPISVVHKNASDINRSREDIDAKKSDNGILAVSARLKLIEAVVWCSRLVKIEKISNIVTYIGMGVGTLLVLIAAIFGFVSVAFQYILLLYLLLPAIAIFVVTVIFTPTGSYFTVESLERDEENKKIKAQRKNNK